MTLVRTLLKRCRGWLPRRGQTPAAPRARRARPSLEWLEARWVPATRIFTGTNSELWSDAGNWQGGQKPAQDGSDDVQLSNAVNSRVDETTTIVKLDIQAGHGAATLTVDSSLTVKGAFTHTGGSVVIPVGGIMVAESAVTIDGRTLTNSGFFHWKSTSLDLNNGAVFVTDGSFYDEPHAQNKGIGFRNTSTFRLTGTGSYTKTGSHHTVIGASFQTQSAQTNVDLFGGEITLAGGGSSAGKFNVSNRSPGWGN